MRIHFKSNILLINICKDLASITNKAKLQIKDVKYDKDNSTIIIPIKRYCIVGVKKKFLFIPERLVFDKNIIINSNIIIKNIRNCLIKNKCEKNISEVIILFGVHIENKEVYISSAEEIEGETLFEIKLKISDYDIEFVDND